MTPAVYDKYYKQFEKSLIGQDVGNIDNVRHLSKLFAVKMRKNNNNDLYARKYHAYFFTRWCDSRGITYPIDWNPEGFWNLQFS
jgi:hypothetical protein